MKASWLVRVSGLSLALAIGAPAVAQEAIPGIAATEADPEEVPAAGEILVTAQRRSERLQDVPIAVNVASAEQLQSSGVTDLTQLNTLVPGLTIANTLGAFQPSIRGVGTSSNIVENPVALYVDGVYLPQQREGLREVEDVEQITVLKGPQGTLFGRNATAGVIQISTRGPSFTPQVRATFGYDNYDTVRAYGFVTGGLSSGVAASLSASYSTQGEGWGKSLTTGSETYKLFHSASLRAKLLFRAGDKTELTLIGDYLDRADSGAVYQPYPGTTFSYPGFGPVTSRYDTYAGDDSYNTFKGGGISLTVQHEFDFGKLVSITSYRKGDGGFKFDFDNVAAPLIVSTAKAPSEGYTQELQLITTLGGKVEGVAGVYYFHYANEYEFFNRDIQGGFPAGPPAILARIFTSSKEVTESIAPFAQIDWEFLPRTKLTIGARYTIEKRTLSGVGGTVLRTGLIQSAPAAQPPLKFEEPTWRLALNHKLDEDTLLYVSYSRGFKSGGFNIATLSNPGYLPENLDDYEVGFKTTLFDGALRLNGNAFYYKYRNQQVATFVNLTQVITNGAAAKLYGVDVDFSARLTKGLTLSGGFELMHTEFTSYPNAVISTPRPGGGAILSPGNAAGKRLPLAQNFVGTLAADYETVIGASRVHLNITGTRNGDYYFEADNFLRQSANTMLNASVEVSNRNENLSLTFAVNNILDASGIARNVTQTYAYYVNYGVAPRVYSITARAKF